MKHFIIFVSAVLFIFSSCNSNKKTDTQKQSNEITDGLIETTRFKALSDFDLVYLDNGKLVFYNVFADKSKVFKKETDSVVNAIYSDKNKLYYTVSENQNLVLKCLDLNEKSPKPEKVVDWNVKLNECKTRFIGNLGDLRLNLEQNQIGIKHGYIADLQQFSKLVVYDFLLQELKEYTLFTYNPQTGEIKDGNEIIYFQPYYYYNQIFNKFESTLYGDLSYVKEDTKISLTDQFEYRDFFQIKPEESADYIDLSVVSSSPDNSKVLFTAMLPWDNYRFSTFCVSSMDGKMQKMLRSEINNVEPQWLADGSLVFVGNETTMDEKTNTEKRYTVLKIMSPEGEIRTVGNASDFAVKKLHF